MSLKLIFLIVNRVVSVLGLSRREAWWKDAEILMLHCGRELASFCRSGGPGTNLIQHPAETRRPAITAG